MAKTKLTRAQQIKRKKRKKKNARVATIIGIITIIIIVVTVLLWIFVFNKNVASSSEPTVMIDGEEIVVESQEIGELEGTWVINKNIYVFDPDGTGIFSMDCDPISFVYVAKDGRLYINFLDEELADCEYSYKVSGDKLTLTAENGTTGGIYELTRDK